MTKLVVGKISVTIDGDKVSVCRERRATPGERKLSSAKTIAENVNLTFGKGDPKVAMDLTPCD